MSVFKQYSSLLDTLNPIQQGHAAVSLHLALSSLHEYKDSNLCLALAAADRLPLMKALLSELVMSMASGIAVPGLTVRTAL